MHDYATGTPSLEEACDRWKADPNGPDLKDGEYHAAYKSLKQHLESRHSCAGWPPDVYVRGDCFGDKTQYVYFYRPEILDTEFLAYLQQWLRNYGSSDWRIIVATELGNAAAVVVYPNIIRAGREYEHNLAESLAAFIRKMRERDKASAHPCLKPA